MDFFDGMENQIELEIGFKKLMAVFIHFYQTVTDEDISEFENQQKKTTLTSTAIPKATTYRSP